MKVKTPHQTAEIGKLHGYLGHFAQPRHINRGHNDLPDTKTPPRTVNDTKPVYDKPLMVPASNPFIDSRMHTRAPATLDDNTHSTEGATFERLPTKRTRM